MHQIKIHAQKFWKGFGGVGMGGFSCTKNRKKLEETNKHFCAQNLVKKFSHGRLVVKVVFKIYGKMNPIFWVHC